MNSGLLGYNGNVMFNGAGYPMYAVDSTGPKHWDVTGTGILTYGQNVNGSTYTDNAITTNYMLANHEWAYFDENTLYIRATASKFNGCVSDCDIVTTNWEILDNHDYPGSQQEYYQYHDPRSLCNSASNFSECTISGTVVVEPVLQDDTTMAMDVCYYNAYVEPHYQTFAHVDYNDLVNGKWTVPFELNFTKGHPYICLCTSGDRTRVYARRRETPYAWGDIKVYQTPVNIYINR